MQILRGEIYLADFEFTHIKESKTRPVLILQCDEDNQNPHYPFVVIAPITTKKTDKIYKQDIFLPKEISNLEKDSKVLLGTITVITKHSLIKRVGKVDEEIMKKVDLKLVRLLGLLKIG